MTVKECYDAMGGNYDEVLGRLRKDERIQKFLLRFPEDPSYGQLKEALDKHDVPEAFRASHTLKGTGQNLALTPLYQSADILCEALRGKETYEDRYAQLFKDVERDYALVTGCIGKLAG
jgi:hypothetical protein